MSLYLLVVPACLFPCLSDPQADRGSLKGRTKVQKGRTVEVKLKYVFYVLRYYPLSEMDRRMEARSPNSEWEMGV